VQQQRIREWENIKHKRAKASTDRRQDGKSKEDTIQW
jgi:hypothetical protein